MTPSPRLFGNEIDLRSMDSNNYKSATFMSFFTFPASLVISPLILLLPDGTLLDL